MAKVDFKELPQEAKNKILAYLTEETRQKIRIVCTEWNDFINKEFPLEVEITNENTSAMFRRGNVSKATIRDLTVEIHENVIDFSDKLRHLESVGKVVTSNLTILLKSCKNIETLSFSSLKEILTIDSTEIIELPKVITIQMKVRGEHQMFTLAEMILIDWVTKRLEFGSLKAIHVKGSSPAEIWAEHRHDMESSQGFSENNSSLSTSTIYDLSREITAVSSAAQSGNALHPIPGQRNLTRAEAPVVSLNAGGPPSLSDANVDGVLVQDLDGFSGSPQPDEIVLNSDSNAINTVHVPSVASEGTETTISNSNPDDNRSQQSTNADSQYSYSRQSIFDRVLRRNILASEDDTEDTGEVNDISLENNYSLLPAYYFYNSNAFTESSQAAVSNSVFIKLLLKNSRTLNQLIVSTRSDFLCFGNLVTFAEDCKNLQFENLEYNFGRSIIYMEFMLLRVQTNLAKIRIQLIEDMLESFLFAIKSSSNTLKDIDVKIMSFSEDREPFQYKVFSECKSLTSFKILHFSSKDGLDTLPISIERLLMNGPLTLSDLNTLATRLVNLKECNLLLNVNMGIIDIHLFKSFLRLPKLRMLSFVQCDVDVDGIEALCNSLPGLVLSVEGPRKLNALPDIQYVIVTIAEKFKRELLG